MHNSHLKVAIIGAGPARFVVTRHLSESPDLQVTVFEVKNDIGGLWVHDEKKLSWPPFRFSEIQRSFLPILRQLSPSIDTYFQSNLPIFMAAFKDFSHPEPEKDFPLYFNAAQQKKNLDAYADKFDLRKHVKFNTLVKSMRLYKNLSAEEQARAPEKRKFIIKTTAPTD